MIESSFGLPQLMLIVFFVGTAGSVYLAWRRRRLVFLLLILPLLIALGLLGRGGPPASHAMIISLEGGQPAINREAVRQGDHFVSDRTRRIELLRPTGPETGRGTWVVIINDSERLLTIKVYAYHPVGVEVYVEPDVVGFVRPGEVWWTSRSIGFYDGGSPPTSMQRPWGASSQVYNLEVEEEPFDVVSEGMSEAELEALRARFRAEELAEIAEILAEKDD